MKNLLLLTIGLFASVNTYANHCPKPEKLPAQVKTAAQAAVQGLCPGTVSQEGPLVVAEWDFTVWDTEATYTIQFKNRGYATGDVDYDFVVGLEGECRGLEDLTVKYVTINEGCY